MVSSSMVLFYGSFLSFVAMVFRSMVVFDVRSLLAFFLSPRREEFRLDFSAPLPAAGPAPRILRLFLLVVVWCVVVRSCTTLEYEDDDDDNDEDSELSDLDDELFEGSEMRFPHARQLTQEEREEAKRQMVAVATTKWGS
jgi:hypothetical protein